MAAISLCMIVKNEEDVLERVLKSVENIFDEIIIADTGSSDNTKKIAYKYTDKVYDFKWIQDFSAARNFVCSKASTDYWMWLDADDIINKKWRGELLKLKENIDTSVDMVMMKYVTGFDKDDKPSFYYYRERIIKNHMGYSWEGRVHEAIVPKGKIIYSDIEIEHRKINKEYTDRNLKIYEDMLEKGEKFDPRSKFYYGRELYFNGKYEKAVNVFKEFLKEGKGWIENNIDACLQMARCYEKMGIYDERMKSLIYSFYFDVPRAEICCEIGRGFMEIKEYERAVYWYKRAVESENYERGGGFIQKDFYDYIPYIQICVCYDKMGDIKNAFEYHKLSKKIKPDSAAVISNERYFESYGEELN